MIIVLIILILLFIITGFITGNFLFNLALNPKSSKAIIFNNGIDEEKELMRIENEKWLSENVLQIVCIIPSQFKFHPFRRIKHIHFFL